MDYLDYPNTFFFQLNKSHKNKNKQNKLRGLSPRANYTGQATAACQ
jgi:hypothetical protein